MKKIVLSICILTGLIACDQKPEGYNIEGNLTGEVENGTKVFLRGVGDNNQLVDIDTAYVESSKFSFTGAAEIPEMHYIFVDNIADRFQFILNENVVHALL